MSETKRGGIYRCPDCRITAGRLVLCEYHARMEAEKRLCVKCDGPLANDGYCFRACEHIKNEPGTVAEVEAAIVALVPPRDRARLMPQIDRIMELVEAMGAPDYDTEEGYTTGVDPR